MNFKMIYKLYLETKKWWNVAHSDSRYTSNIAGHIVYKPRIIYGTRDEK